MKLSIMLILSILAISLGGCNSKKLNTEPVSEGTAHTGAMKNNVKDQSKEVTVTDTFTIELESLFPSKNFNECMGIVLNQQKDIIYFATNGKFIYEYNLQNKTEPKLITTIKEVTQKWNDDYGDTFLHDIELGSDGQIYAAAENCILKIDPTTGGYTTLIKDVFKGGWGAYGIDLDKDGNIFVGDHHGGIHFYLKKKNWLKKTIIAGSKTGAKKKSFGGVLVNNDVLYYLDFENSLLHSVKLERENDFPKITPSEITSLKIPVPYPEYLEVWKEDIFVKAARENTMFRVRDNQVIQKIDFACSEEVSPIVTFAFYNSHVKASDFYGVSWGPQGTMFKGRMDW